MRLLEIFLTSLRLGLTSFGGPIAHLSYFHEEYVKRKKWISDEAYADLVALCQFLPGPASSQVGMGIGLSRGGVLGAIFSWLGFTLPSAIILILFGLGLTKIELAHHQVWLHGLKIAAVSVVAHAVFSMWKKLCPDFIRKVLAIVSCVVVLFVPSASAQFLVLIVSGFLGAFFLKGPQDLPHDPIHNKGRSTGAAFLFVFIFLLFFLPLLAKVYPHQAVKMFDSFYRAGSLVFGGGHVVLPLLQAEVVPTGWVSKDLFMAGYGVANAIPGPLFAFSAYLGAVSSLWPNEWTGAFLCLVAAFLPSFLLVVGVLPFWEKLRTYSQIRQGMLGLNAAVVGILLAAFYHPVCTSAIFSFKDIVIAMIGFLLLQIRNAPSWAVVLLSVGLNYFIRLLMSSILPST